MRRLIPLPLVAALGLTAVLAGAGPAEAQKLRVVATLPDLWALTKVVGGDDITLDLAMRFGQNPHEVEMRPSQVLILKRADVLIRNSLDGDFWVDAMVEAANNPKILRGAPNVIEAGRGIEPLKVPAVVDRSLGDVHPLGNPHYALDPANVLIVTANILTGLSRAAPDRAAKFEANRQTFLERLAAADKRWRETLAPFRGAKLVSFHDAFPYFYRAFGLVEAGLIEDRPGVPPSPGHVTALIRKMKDETIKIVLHETYYPRDVSDLVARQTGATVILVSRDPGAIKGTEDYIAHMDFLVNTIAKALG